MDFLNKLFGRGGATERRPDRRPDYGPSGGQTLSDEQALERYRYMVRTAPPEQVEQAHAEAFAQLTPDQRRAVLEELGRVVPDAERARDDDPRSLARMATRAEMRQPGTVERALANRGGMGMGAGGGIGLGGMLAGTLLASVAGSFIGSAIANEFFANDSGFAGGAESFAGGADAGGDTFDDIGGDFGDI